MNRHIIIAILSLHGNTEIAQKLGHLGLDALTKQPLHDANILTLVPVRQKGHNVGTIKLNPSFFAKETGLTGDAVISHFAFAKAETLVFRWHGGRRGGGTARRRGRWH